MPKDACSFVPKLVDPPWLTSEGMIFNGQKDSPKINMWGLFGPCSTNIRYSVLRVWSGVRE